MHTCTQAHMHTCTHAHMRTWTHTCMHAGATRLHPLPRRLRRPRSAGSTIYMHAYMHAPPLPRRLRRPRSAGSTIYMHAYMHACTHTYTPLLDLGVQLFGGRFGLCSDSSYLDVSACEEGGGAWHNPKRGHFDNAPAAALQLFEMSSLEGCACAHAFPRAHVHTCTCSRAHMACACTCVHAHAHAHAHVHVHAHAHGHGHGHGHGHAHAHMHMRTHTCTCAHAHTHMHMRRWVDVLWAGVDSTAVGHAPQRDAHPARGLFFISK